MPTTVTLEEAEWRFIVDLLYQASGPGISMAVTQPLMVKIAQQLPKQSNQKPVLVKEGQPRR